MSSVLTQKKSQRNRPTTKPAVVRLMGQKFALVPLEEWTSLKETQYLLENPASAAQLMEGVQQVRRGNTRRVSLQELRTRLEGHV